MVCETFGISVAGAAQLSLAGGVEGVVVTTARSKSPLDVVESAVK